MPELARGVSDEHLPELLAPDHHGAAVAVHLHGGRESAGGERERERANEWFKRSTGAFCRFSPLE